MAAITTTTNDWHENIGSLALRHVQIDIAANGDTLAHGMRAVLNAFTNDPASVTKITIGADDLTFTTGGAVTDVELTIIGKP